jgi:hypothetical protein
MNHRQRKKFLAKKTAKIFVAIFAPRRLRCDHDPCDNSAVYPLHFFQRVGSLGKVTPKANSAHEEQKSNGLNHH